ncbi:oxidoreductase [Amorphoplanes digitatis]|uniref:NAD(P)-dependent dehydrogenase (Short-subunit alcohol dehydrogenase family) n=1 Tax=Actinoplanes digitatis TaxID=1868 RepID=A0A7W7I1U9_9ACTN|nr:oxidoreductase [Actinoplanes digitatis]MBB4764859.1 NAD(P)-dependent dehydrogenase (short-subunit alcohol dehydrogenase family) [Actinoplanes digitatis]
MAEKLAIVTGASGGIGFHTARELAARNWRVITAARHRNDDIPGAEWWELDLADLASVRRFASRFLDGYGRLDLLINNAGVMALPRAVTVDGFERQFGVNHLGHFALTGLLLPALLAGDRARVVTVTSGLHRRGRMNFDDLMGERRYSKLGAYTQSKLANVLFALELGRRTPLTSVLAHPGFAHTDLARTGNPLRSAFLALARLSAQSAEAGALPSLHAATNPEVKAMEAYGPDGPGERRGNPTRIEVSARGRDEGDARRLWAISEELTGVRYRTVTVAD